MLNENLLWKNIANTLVDTSLHIGSTVYAWNSYSDDYDNLRALCLMYFLTLYLKMEFLTEFNKHENQIPEDSNDFFVTELKQTQVVS